MDQKIKRQIVWWGCLLSLFILSYWREVGFRSINAIIAGETLFYAKTTHLHILREFTTDELFKLKYVLTISLTILFAFLTLIGARWGLSNRLGLILAIILYICTLVLGIVITCWGIFFSDFQTVYLYLRILIGWIHNPLIFLFISIIVHSSNSFK